MANIELAKAYVTIVPSMQGAQQTITEELTGAGSAAGESAGAAAGSGFAAALGVAAKVGVAAVTAAATGISALTTQAVQSYADYEQLVGGIETLYGESADLMMQYSTEAAQATGQSMNDYMEAAISTSAAMISAVEGDQRRAAELTNQAMIDMADNANKLGTDMEMIQNAYRGFSRGNFTMLDNLALGFAGTREGMQELLDQAQEISGFEYSIDSYADIVEAIHVVQTELGITGTTANEASSTISGSFGAVAASWENLMTGIANPDADLQALIDNFVLNTETAVGNLVPVVTNALTGLSTVITQMTPVLTEQLSLLVPTILPSLLSAASNIVISLAQGIISSLPTLAPIAADLVVSLVTFLVDNLPLVVSSAIDIVIAIVDGISRALPELIPAVIACVTQICTTLIDHIPELVAAGIELTIAVGLGLLAAIPDLITMTPQVISAILDSFSQLGPQLASSAMEWAGDLIDSFVSGITNGISRVRDAVTGIADSVRSFLGFSEPEEGPLSNFHTYAPDMVDLFTEGLEDSQPQLEAALSSTFAMPTLSSPDYGSTYGDEFESAGGDLVIPVYVGQERLDTIMLRSSQMATYRRGS